MKKQNSNPCWKNGGPFQSFWPLRWEISIFSTVLQTCSPWTACSVFDWKYLFRVNLVEKLRIISLSWYLVPRLSQICRIPWWCSLFLFSTGSTFLAKFDLKNQNCQFELKFRTRLIWVCRIMYKICSNYFLCFRPEEPFFGKSCQKILKLSV